MSTNDKKPGEFRTSIGGQALIEGIMMRGVGKAAMAVRKKDGEIVPTAKHYACVTLYDEE